MPESLAFVMWLVNTLPQQFYYHCVLGNVSTTCKDIRCCIYKGIRVTVHNTDPASCSTLCHKDFQPSWKLIEQGPLVEWGLKISFQYYMFYILCFFTVVLHVSCLQLLGMYMAFFCNFQIRCRFRFCSKYKLLWIMLSEYNYHQNLSGCMGYSFKGSLYNHFCGNTLYVYISLV